MNTSVSTNTTVNEILGILNNSTGGLPGNGTNGGNSTGGCTITNNIQIFCGGNSTSGGGNGGGTGGGVNPPVGNCASSNILVNSTKYSFYQNSAEKC